MTVAKNLFMPLAFAMTVMTGCGGCESSNDKDPPKPVRPSQMIDGALYTIIDTNQVGVTVEHDKVSAYLFNGDGDRNISDRRRSVYFLREGAVITELHADAQTPGLTNSNPRPVRQMLDYELAEFQKAQSFYKTENPFQLKDSSAVSNKQDSLKGGPK